MTGVFCMPPGGLGPLLLITDWGVGGPSLSTFGRLLNMTGRMLSLMLDRVTHALITYLAETAGVSRSAWCRDVLQAAAMAELDRQEQAEKKAAALAEQERRRVAAEELAAQRLARVHTKW